jgi:hypothetical protein
LRWSERRVAIAAAAQRDQLLLQRAQRSQALPHARDVIVEQGIT